MLISLEEYDLLVRYTEWLRCQPDDGLELWHSEKVVTEFLEEDE